MRKAGLTRGGSLFCMSLMKMKWMALLAACTAAIWASGCHTSVDGRQHLGVPLMKDTIEGRYERAPMEVWKAAQDVLSYNGTLYSTDTLKSTLEASVNNRTVWVKVEPLDDKVTRVIVQTRTKGGTSDLELASEIDKQIALRLATGNLTPSARPAAKAAK